MRDPHGVLSQARERAVPTEWAVFTKQRGRVRSFFSGSSDDPDPLLVITPEGSVEYVDGRKPLVVVDFTGLAGVELRVDAHSFSDSTIVTLNVWVDLLYRGGQRTKWQSSSFRDDVRTVQAFIEGFAVHRAVRGDR